MNKKTYELIVGVTGGVATIASAVVAYLKPEYRVQIITAIGIVSTAVTEVCSLFIKVEEKVEKKVEK